VVWHKAFFHILDSIRKYLKTGYTFTNCADSIARHIFWFILIASADYEEQYVSLKESHYLYANISIRCMISLIRGVGSNFPCPICLVPADQQTNLSTIFPERTMENMQEIYLNAQKLASGPKDELLKSYGLRDAEVCQE